MAPKKQGGYDDKKDKTDTKVKDTKKEQDKESEPVQHPEARSSNESMFAPANVNNNIEELTSEFNKLSLAEQLVVAKSFESFNEQFKKRKSAIKSVKQIQQKIENSNKKKDPKEKELSERYKKTPLMVRVWFEGQVYEIEIFLSDRLGTLRQLLCRKLGLKKDQKMGFQMDGQPLLKKDDQEPSNTTFLYTLNNIQNGAELTLSLIESPHGVNDDNGDNDDNDEVIGSDDVNNQSGSSDDDTEQ
ncbi:unnamed protein product [Effrenium voratum]|uniref:Ubiquitin-like domain-containing protein n=1 Tax=Effrenium voratum TaxID=2562239 RepID=A0AA36IG75_9DINO|nr:unnamed protein product [Effrenium voratum]